MTVTEESVINILFDCCIIIGDGLVDFFVFLFVVDCGKLTFFLSLFVP